MTKPPDMPPEVAEVFAGFPREARERLIEIRELIFETAGANSEVGHLTETLKWGEPAYLTEETGSGSTIRLAWKGATPTEVGLYFHCRTTLVESFRVEWGDELTFEGNRCVVLPLEEVLPRDPIRGCIEAALSYHLA